MLPVVPLVGEKPTGRPRGRTTGGEAFRGAMDQAGTRMECPQVMVTSRDISFALTKYAMQVSATKRVRGFTFWCSFSDFLIRACRYGDRSEKL